MMLSTCCSREVKNKNHSQGQMVISISLISFSIVETLKCLILKKDLVNLNSFLK